MLALDDFKHVVEHTPLFAIDLVVVNPNREILVGLRKNAPAKDFWFVPGGRVYKNESLDKAFVRISTTELGGRVERCEASLLGLFDHFYDDSFFSESVSTHYINATHVIRLEAKNLKLPIEQHKDYRWLSMQALSEDTKVHPFSKIFLPKLKAWLEQ